MTEALAIEFVLTAKSGYPIFIGKVARIQILWHQLLHRILVHIYPYQVRPILGHPYHYEQKHFLRIIQSGFLISVMSPFTIDGKEYYSLNNKYYLLPYSLL